MKLVFYRHWKTYIFFVILLIVTLVIGIYIYKFKDLPIGGPSDFANFATYFNGLLSPVLTVFTIGALVFTLFHQQKQMMYLDLIRRFDKHVDMIEKEHKLYADLKNTKIGECDVMSFTLEETKYIQKNDPRKVSSDEFKRNMKRIIFSDRKELSEIEFLYSFHLKSLKVKALNIFCLTRDFYQTAAEILSVTNKNDFLIIDMFRNKACEVLSEMVGWGLLTNEERELFTGILVMPSEIDPLNKIRTYQNEVIDKRFKKQNHQ